MGVVNFFTCSLAVLAAAAAAASPVEQRSKKGPKSFFQELGNSTWVIGNDVWNVTQNRQYADKLWYKGQDRVGKAVGHYVSYNGAASDLNWTSAAIADSGEDWINVRFTAKEGDFHWLIQDGRAGAHQYFVNRALPTLGEFRTLWRLDNASFPRGYNNVKDGDLPALAEYVNATNVQDETWQKADGTFLTKYDWSGNLREQRVWGVYGKEVGSWYVHAGKEYFNGDQTKQELMVHRESKTGDTVQLNMIHGTHFQATSRDSFTPGKIWGPWLWYLNDGSVADAHRQYDQEVRSWPYKWFAEYDAAFRSRGKIQGRLRLSDGRPASGAAVFLGDNRNESVSTLDQGQGYYYTTYADEQGKFSIRDIRTGTYALYAWANGGSISDVTTKLTHNDVVVSPGTSTNLKDVAWAVRDPRKRIFQLGALDRKTDGFGLANPQKPFQHARIAKCPPNLTYTVGTSRETDWCFGQAAVGTWSIKFPIRSECAPARLTLSLAGFSQGSSAHVLLNGRKVGNITSASLANSQDTYRGATRSGEWRLLEFPVEEGGLRQGWNELDVRVTNATQWRGWLWDSVVLEWV